MRLLRPIFITTILLLISSVGAYAQGGDATYTIQLGDTLGSIALQHSVPLAELADWNSITNPNLIFVGQKLTIPEPNILLRPQPQIKTSDQQTYIIQPGDMLFNIANRYGITMDQLVTANNIVDVDLIQVGQSLVIPTTGSELDNASLPYPFQSATLSHARIEQGHTLAIYVALARDATLDITFDDRPVFVDDFDRRNQWGLVGIHALQEAGIYPLTLRATGSNGNVAEVIRNVTVVEGGYNTEHIQVIAGRESLLVPGTIQSEFELLSSLWNQISPEPRWRGAFGYPIDEVRVTSFYGTRRSYNDGPVSGFHTGSDFGGATGTPIYAPAPGRVVLADTLNVRGGAVLIDHGLGVFTGYWHQSEIAVNVGDEVWQGQVIGYLGGTGLVTGPHLHWEMRVGGIAVDPVQWVQEVIP